jgi:hypothetical protein
MDTLPFFIEFKYENNLEIAEVKPCCEENNVYYYDILMKNQYQFTITPAIQGGDGLYWRVSLKNADKQVDQQLVEIIGEQIEKHYV